MLAAVAAIAFTSCKEEKAADKVNEENVADVAERDANAEGTAKMSFEEEMHDFGTINEGDVVEHTFKFTNTGDAPLVITNAKGSCGSTVPSWPKDPIAPGATGEMLVKLSSPPQARKITILGCTQAGLLIILDEKPILPQFSCIVFRLQFNNLIVDNN